MCASAWAISRPLSATWRRFDSAESSRENSRSPAFTRALGATANEPTTPSCGAATAIAFRAITSAGASTDKRTGISMLSASAPSTSQRLRPLNHCLTWPQAGREVWLKAAKQ